MALSDPMLLTHPPPAKTEFDFRAPHEFIPPISPRHKRVSPKAERDFLPPFSTGVAGKMSTPHRGLPPPASIGLPDPTRIAPPLPATASFSGMPPPPAQWQGAEESMRHWLVTKAEEEKRKQEEERTRQENLRLEQRRIEQSMLQESIRNGVPPPLVPMIFAGIGGHNLAGVSLEWLQQYAAQIQVAQQQLAAQQQPQTSPDSRRDSRLLGQAQPPAYGAASGQQMIPAGQTPPGPPPPPQFGSYPSGVMSPSSAARQPSGGVGAPTSAPRPPLGNLLPRLTTNEAQVQPIPSAQAGPPPPSHSAPQESSSSPLIYFHHWVPPTTQAGSGNPPATPSEYTSSPKKRKAPGGHPPAPVPTSAPQTSPSFSHISSSSTPGRRGGHYRTRSDVSTRASDAAGRPTTSSSKAESSGQVELDQERQRRLQQQVPHPGAAGGEDRSDSGSQHSSNGVSAAHPHQPGGSGGGSAPASPKRQGRASAESRKSSFGVSRPP